MDLHLDGSMTINAPRAVVFGLLTDPNFLAKTLPDAEDVQVLNGASLQARLKVRVSVVSSKLNIKMRLADIRPPETATLLVEGTGTGSTIRVTSTFTLSGDSPTRMGWSADAEITGIMAGLGSSLLKGFATKKVGEIFAGITRAIEGAAVP